jgi:hypothetical protein
LYQSRYCGGYVARAALTFSIDESRCTSLAGRVYEGLIYYKRLYKSDSGTFVVADEGYRNAGGAEFAELIEAARRSDLAKSGIEEPNPRVDQDYFGGTSAEGDPDSSSWFRDDDTLVAFRMCERRSIGIHHASLRARPAFARGVRR